MNIELALLIAKERNRNWRDQAAIDREIRKYQPFKFPQLFALRRDKLSRKHA